MYQDGLGYVGDELRENAPLMIVGQNPGDEEEAHGQPFIGKTGADQDKTYLPKTGLSREDCSLTNAIRCRWRGHGNDLPPVDSRLFRDALGHCTRAHARIPSGTKLILATGGYAGVATTGEKVGGDPTDSWRGYLVPHISSKETGRHFHDIWVPGSQSLPVLLTQHTAYLYRNPEWTPVVLRDWSKVGRYLKGTWPKACPKLTYQAPAIMPHTFAFDTEFDGPTLHRWSAATRRQDKTPHVWVVEATPKGTGSVVQPGSTLITQNALADIGFLGKVFTLQGESTVEDTMLAHAVLFSDLPHSLNFLGSLYSSMNRWKHLGYSGSNPQLYAGADAWGTWEVWESLLAEFRQDPTSWTVYKDYTLPLVPIIYKAEQAGMRVNKSRLAEVQGQLAQVRTDARLLGQASVGWPLNLGSPAQVGDYLYRILGINPRRQA
jgi:uracil-DNA glycosylase family 4